jgi:hypothetical protein
MLKQSLGDSVQLTEYSLERGSTPNELTALTLVTDALASGPSHSAVSRRDVAHEQSVMAQVRQPAALTARSVLG